MKKILLLSLLLASVAYAEEDCPAAVDAADAQNPNAYKNCDYSDSGLNGVLHRTWKKSKQKDEGGEAVVADNLKTAPATADQAIKEEPVSAKNILAKGEFSSAQQLQSLRFGLVQKASTDCPKGFLLESEKYLPAADKAMKLELLYHCL